MLVTGCETAHTVASWPCKDFEQPDPAAQKATPRPTAAENIAQLPKEIVLLPVCIAVTVIWTAVMLPVGITWVIMDEHQRRSKITVDADPASSAAALPTQSSVESKPTVQ